jgi:hypothetical protein
MRFEPNDRQALFLWRMITGETPEEREPTKGNATPDIKGDRKLLFDNGFLSVDRRRGHKGRAADHIILTEKAWAWASRGFDVEIMHSKFAAHALQGLLRRLLPFLNAREIALAEVFSRGGASEKRVSAAASKKRRGVADGSKSLSPLLVPEPTWTQIEEACVSLGGGARKARVRLSSLRKALPTISRQRLDKALVALQRQQRLVLYRDDNTPALTAEDHAAALIIGDSPRHLVYLEA